MSIIMKNKIPQILKERNLSTTGFQILLAQGGKNTFLSYPIVRELATKEELRGSMALDNIKKAVIALGITFNDAIELVEA